MCAIDRIRSRVVVCVLRVIRQVTAFHWPVRKPIITDLACNPKATIGHNHHSYRPVAIAVRTVQRLHRLIASSWHGYDVSAPLPAAVQIERDVPSQQTASRRVRAWYDPILITHLLIVPGMMMCAQLLFGGGSERLVLICV